jgi:catechol 2,3-dioxygenase-like lactoylglutathione lyase family enzyme
MKRFHVHLHVDDLAKSIAFYSHLFAAAPARVESDYAKWMLDDPRLNFAISTRGAKAGIDHLGFQTDDADELAALKERAEAADMALLDEGETTCCLPDRHLQLLRAGGGGGDLAVRAELRCRPGHGGRRAGRSAGDAVAVLAGQP